MLSQVSAERPHRTPSLLLGRSVPSPAALRRAAEDVDALPAHHVPRSGYLQPGLAASSLILYPSIILCFADTNVFLRPNLLVLQHWLCTEQDSVSSILFIYIVHVFYRYIHTYIRIPVFQCRETERSAKPS